MEELFEYFDYAKVFIYISLGIIVITFIIDFFFKEHNFARYIPGLILIGIGIYGLLRAIRSTNQLDGVNSMMLFVIGVGGGLIGLLTGLAIGILKKEEGSKIIN